MSYIQSTPTMQVYFYQSYGDHRNLHSFPTRRSSDLPMASRRAACSCAFAVFAAICRQHFPVRAIANPRSTLRSEEHTSELQSRFDLVCRLLLEKKKADVYTKTIFDLICGSSQRTCLH